MRLNSACSNVVLWRVKQDHCSQTVTCSFCIDKTIQTSSVETIFEIFCWSCNIYDCALSFTCSRLFQIKLYSKI